MGRNPVGESLVRLAQLLHPFGIFDNGPLILSRLRMMPSSFKQALDILRLISGYLLHIEPEKRPCAPLPFSW